MSISHELDSIGAESNAFTGQEFTGYWAKADAKHFTKIFDVISDIYLNSTFPEVEMQKEKGVIIEEINMYEDLPNQHVQELFMKLLYGDTPAGRSIAGTRENIKAMRQIDFINYKKAHYVPSATAVVVAGPVDHKKIVSLVENTFGNLKSTKKTGKVSVYENQKIPATILEYKKTDQAHLVLGVRSYDIFHKDDAILSVMSSVLAGGMSSRLFQKLREEMGVCYYVRSANDAFTDHGFFNVSVGSDTKRVEEVMKAILKEFSRLKIELVPENELEKVKEWMIGRAKMGFLETADSSANFYGMEEILKGKVVPFSEIEKKIRKVSAKDLKRVAQNIFKEKNLNLAIIGPYKNKASFQKILKIE